MPAGFMVMASRVLESDDGALTVQIVRKPPFAEDGEASFGYRILDAGGTLVDSMILMGSDEVQALLFALTAVGDYLARFHPSAAWCGLSEAGFLRTTFEDPETWTAKVLFPLSAG